MSDKPIRIQRKRTKGWKLPPNTVCVDRSTRWGNPFVVGKHGTQAECVELHTALLAGYLCASAGNIKEQAQHRIHVIHHIEDLRGKNLACWCRVGTPCHADILLKISNAD